MNRVVLVGATGSIGQSTQDVVRALGLRLHGVYARSNAVELARVATDFNVRYAGLADEVALPALRTHLSNCETGSGDEFLEAMIADPETDVVVSAAAGAAGLPASLMALQHGKRLALANKESMVMAGPLLLRLAARTGADIVPIDSEHSAIFQALRAGGRDEVRRVILTASGGPFRTASRERIAEATAHEALNHPTWSMGPKITIDSATLMNKTLELIEAHWLFEELPSERLEIVIHPQSVVHSMVEFVDGSIIAQMGKPDMRVPIQYALTYPERRPPAFVGFDVRDFAHLTFEAPDVERFPAVAIGPVAVRLGGTAGAIVNAANEVAVDRFLRDEIPFPAIAETVAAVLENSEIQPDPVLDDIYAADLAAREEAAHCRT